MRLNTWAGRVEYRPWDAARHVVCIEDPFDATDNPGRSLAQETIGFVADEFKEAAAAMHLLGTTEGELQKLDMTRPSACPAVQLISCL